MLKNIVRKLENPKRPLLGPNIKALEFWGLLLPERPFKRYFYIFMHINVTVFTASELAEVWFLRDDMNLLLNNLKITLLAAISVCKVSTMLAWQKYWKDIINYVSESDLNRRDFMTIKRKSIINRYTKYSRKITYFHWALMYTTVTIVNIQILIQVYKFIFTSYGENISNGTLKYVQVISSWVPFSKTTIPGFLMTSAYQIYAATYGSGWITSYDTNAIVIMVFLRGELELLRVDSANIFGEKSPVSDAEALRRLKDCQRRHVQLMKYSRLFDSCLSPIMLLYMFVCSVMLCATVYQITIETSAMQQFLTAEYLIFGIAQLFMYCWHSNEVLYVSKDLMLGPYESTWWKQNVHRQKDVNILVDQFKKTIVFTAGPFTDLTVATFISILKGAYSYYTLLSQSQA
ncbi:odorant receptor Or2-like [Epargyreus clarus]|uniref:odorant receptor Or2-like n=1 Tax=Epargyreus clarus TaxID=520877 RepID=UPI003C2B8E83